MTLLGNSLDQEDSID